MINRQKLNDAILKGAEQWRRDNRELLSCFDQDRLWEVIHAHNDLSPDAEFDAMLKSKITYGELNRRNIMAAAISDDVDEEGLIERGVQLSFDKAFVALWDRGALDSLLVVDDVPARAQQDLDRMAARVEAAKPAPKVVQAAPPPPPVDPVAQCVRDYHEMGSKQFQQKYLSDTRNRKYYELAIEQGNI